MSEAFAHRVARCCMWVDEHLPHRAMWLPGRRLVCSAADTSYGWGPDAVDWAERATWLDRWLHDALTQPTLSAPKSSGSGLSDG